MSIKTNINKFVLLEAKENDVPLILSFISELADYEKLPHEVIATEDALRASLFGERKLAEVLLGYYEDEPVAFTLFFHNYSTFRGQAGLYLEDVYVKPHMRGKGLGKAILGYLANLALARNCGRFEWSVLDWNEAALNFYRSLGAVPMDEWTVQRLDGEALQKLAVDYSNG